MELGDLTMGNGSRLVQTQESQLGSNATEEEGISLFQSVPHTSTISEYHLVYLRSDQCLPPGSTTVSVTQQQSELASERFVTEVYHTIFCGVA